MTSVRCVSSRNPRKIHRTGVSPSEMPFVDHLTVHRAVAHHKPPLLHLCSTWLSRWGARRPCRRAIRRGVRSPSSSVVHRPTLTLEFGEESLLSVVVECHVLVQHSLLGGRTRGRGRWGRWSLRAGRRLRSGRESRTGWTPRPRCSCRTDDNGDLCRSGRVRRSLSRDDLTIEEVTVGRGSCACLACGAGRGRGHILFGRTLLETLSRFKRKGRRPSKLASHVMTAISVAVARETVPAADVPPASQASYRQVGIWVGRDQVCREEWVHIGNDGEQVSGVDVRDLISAG